MTYCHFTFGLDLQNQRRHSSQKLVLYVMAPPVEICSNYWTNSIVPSPFMTDQTFSLLLILLKASRYMVQILSILLLRPLLLHKYTSCRFISNFMIGGAVKFIFPFLRVIWFLLSKICKIILMHLVSNLCIFTLYVNSSFLVPSVQAPCLSYVPFVGKILFSSSC